MGLGIPRKLRAECRECFISRLGSSHATRSLRDVHRFRVGHRMVSGRPADVTDERRPVRSLQRRRPCPATRRSSVSLRPDRYASTPTRCLGFELQVRRLPEVGVSGWLGADRQEPGRPRRWTVRGCLRPARRARLEAAELAKDLLVPADEGIAIGRDWAYASQSFSWDQSTIRAWTSTRVSLLATR